MTHSKLAAFTILMTAIPAIGETQSVDYEVGLEIVVTQPSYIGCGDPAYGRIESSPCEDLATPPRPGLSFAWVVVTRVSGFPQGIGGVQFGLDHGPLIQIENWVNCTSGTEIPQDGWPGPGTGNAVTWGGGCYMPPWVGARVGYLAIEDGSVPDGIDLILDPRIDGARWIDCESTESSICREKLGCTFLAEGTNPHCQQAVGCDWDLFCIPPVSTQDATWSSV